MSSDLDGRIELDVRDSVPDRKPSSPRRRRQERPTSGSSSRTTWGYGTMDCFGGAARSRAPDDRRRPAPEVKP